MFHSSLTATINRLQSGQPDYPEETSAAAAGGAKNRTGKHKASQARRRRRRINIKMVTGNQKEGSLFIERQQEIDKERILVPSIRVTSIVIIVLINLLLLTQGGATGVDGHQASLPTVIVRGFLVSRSSLVLNLFSSSPLQIIQRGLEGRSDVTSVFISIASWFIK